MLAEGRSHGPEYFNCRVVDEHGPGRVLRVNISTWRHGNESIEDL